MGFDGWALGKAIAKFLKTDGKIGQQGVGEIYCEVLEDMERLDSRAQGKTIAKFMKTEGKIGQQDVGENSCEVLEDRWKDRTVWPWGKLLRIS